MKKTFDWIIRLLPAIILLQTLFFKYTGAPESVEIFQRMGIEPWGRYLVATLELVAAILLILPKTAPFGAVMALGLMVGAIGGHLTKIGIEVAGDGGTLFALAILVAACSATIVWKNKLKLVTFVLRHKR